MNATATKAMADRLQIQVATSAIMERAIDDWLLMYMDQSVWAGRDGVKSMNLPSTISEEIARLLLTEFSIHVDGGKMADLINKSLVETVKHLSDTAETWAALGGIALKPYAAGDDGSGRPDRLNVDVVPANRFYPTAYDSNKDITGAVFIETKRKGDYLYTRLEYHNLAGTDYTVINRAFRSERLNASLTDDQNVIAATPFLESVPLDAVEEWAGITPEITLYNVKRPLFVYIRNPRANQTDPSSPLGASVYERARDVIAEADRQYSRILWEYESKETAIEADETLFKLDKNGRPVIPTGKERLYRTYDVSASGSEKTTFLKEYSPEIRDSSLFNGLNRLLRQIESLCGLAFGTISDINTGASAAERTATELRISRQRSYTTISRMQDTWDTGLKQLVEIMEFTAELYQMAPAEKTETSITWGDGVLEDVDKEFTRRWAMVLAGKLKIEKFYSWYFGVTEKEALEMVPEENSLLFPPME